MSKHTATDLNTHYLAKEMTSYVAQREGIIDQIAQGVVEIPPAWQDLIAEHDRIIDELKENGEYFHEGGGSVFMDYKNLRGRVVPEGGMQEIAARFSSSMSKDELLRVARGVVEGWQVGSGQERKR